METDHDRSDAARTGRSRHVTDTTTSASVRASEAEAFDHLHGHGSSRPAASAVDTMARWRGGEVRWVRACDALAQTSGRATGRGITWTEQANRLPRLVPLRPAGTGRRAIDRASTGPRASRLAPVTAFGTRRGPSMARTGVSR